MAIVTAATTQPGNPYALATLTEKGAPPKSRLTDARQGMELFQRLRHAAEARKSVAAVVQGMRDGNAPFDPERLRKRNEAWRSNFSTQEGASRVDAAKTPFYSLITGAQLLAECNTDVGGETVDASTASRVRAEEFDRMLRTFEDFEDEWWCMFEDMILFNRGFFHFPEKDSWRFEQVRWDKVYFPDRTSIKRRKWNFFAIEHSWSVHELWKMAKAGGDRGWNMAAVTEAIRKAMPVAIAHPDDPMSVQRALADYELYSSESSESVPAATLFVQEFDGEWTMMTVALENDGQSRDDLPAGPQSLLDVSKQGSEGRPPQGPQGTGALKNWLCRRERVADRITQVLVPFFYETTGGTVNALKGGLGTRILPIMQMLDRTACGLSDNVQMRSSIVLQPMNASSRARTAAMQLGPITVLPDGFTVQQGTLFGDIEGSIAFRTHMNQTIDTTTGTFRPQFEKPTGNPEPVGTAQLRFAQSAQLSDSAVERFYKRADTFYYELYERAKMDLPDSSDSFIKAARDFQKRCKDRGLTKAQIQDCVRGAIRASRTIGNGSPAMRQQALGAIAPLAMQGMLGPRGLEAWKRETIAAFLGQSGVQKLMPDEDSANVPTRDDMDAVGEIADAQTGAPILFAAWQNHTVHASRKLEAAAQAIASVQQGAEPSMPFVFLQTILPNLQQHIASASPEPVRKKLEQAFKQVLQGTKVVEQAAQQAMQQKQQANQMTFDQQMAVQEMQSKLAISEQKMQGTMQLKAQRQQADLALKAQGQQSQTALSDADTAAGIQRQTASTAADIANAQAKTASEIENQRRKAEAQAAAARNKPKSSGGK